MLRSLLLASAVAACAAAPAFAAPADAITWTGPYVGVNLGYGGGNFNYPYSGTTDAAGTNPVTGRLRQSSTGVLGGGQIGYNYETPNGWVVGLETDLDGTGINGRSAFSSVDGAGNASSDEIKSQIDYLGTVRGRIGRPMFDGRFMPYVTGGFAYGRVKSIADFNCSACGTDGAAVSNFDSAASTRTGWTVGAGTEYALNNHLSFKVEYLYADLGRDTVANDAAQFTGPGVNLFNANVQADANANVVRVGLNYRF